MGEASNSTLVSLNQNLCILKSYLGLEINTTKSNICFSKDCRQVVDLIKILNINQGSFPLKYLGLPLTYGSVKIAFFNPLFDKLQKWLAGWKSKFLSLGGRLQLLRSSVNNYLTYWFRFMAIPKGILKRICSFTAKFFYHSGEGNKLHTISWAQTTLPKEKGGIGLLSASTLNDLCKIKVLWKLSQGESFFAKWCKSKYLSVWNNMPQRYSPLWKGIKEIAHRFQHKISYSIGDGRSFSLFHDPWCNGSSLFSIMGNKGSQLLGIPENANLSLLITNGSWNLPSSFTSTYSTCSNFILSSPITGGRDQILWCNHKHPTKHNFIEAIFESYPNVGWSKDVWFKGNAINFTLYCWMAFLEGLKTSDILAKRGLGSPTDCCFCLSHSESHTHLFFECTYSMNLIRTLLPNGNFLLMQCSLKQIYSSVDYKDHKIIIRLQLLIISAAVYFLWRERNNRLFFHSASSVEDLNSMIRMRIAAKLKRWKFKDSWPDNVKRMLQFWCDYKPP